MNAARDPRVDPVSRQALRRALLAPRFELIPLAGLEEQVERLPAGTTVTVTCSPSRGIENTLTHAARLAAAGFHAVPHLAARLVRDHAHLHEIVRQAAHAGLSEAFIVGGDAVNPAGEFSSGLQLLRALAAIDHPFAALGVPSYPEGHPRISTGVLQDDLRAKQEYAAYTVTQICFDPARIARWLGETRRAGISLPAAIGLPGAIDRRKLLTIGLKIGVGESVRYLSKNVGLAGGLLGGAFRPDDLVVDLAPALADPVLRVAGLHLNTFNQIAATEGWVREMLARLDGTLP